jgi:hypothetical protein
MEGQAFAISNIVVGIVLLIWSVIAGLAIIAFGQLLLAIREVAHNTRKDGVHGAHYNILLIVAKINNLLGWLVLALGVILAVYMMVAGHPIILQMQAPTNPPV